MYEHCYTEVCAYGGEGEIIQNLPVLAVCDVMRDSVLNAGGGALLEASPCPIKAIGSLRDSIEDTVDETMMKADIRVKLGIIAII